MIQSARQSDFEGNYPGSLKDFGINFEMVDLKADGTVDYEAVEQRIREEKPKIGLYPALKRIQHKTFAYIQRNQKTL